MNSSANTGRLSNLNVQDYAWSPIIVDCRMKAMLRLFLIFTCNLNCVADVHFKILLSLCKAWSFVMKMFEALMAFELPIKRYFIFNSKISNNRLNRNNDCYRNIQLVDECFESTRANEANEAWTRPSERLSSRRANEPADGRTNKTKVLIEILLPQHKKEVSMTNERTPARTSERASRRAGPLGSHEQN